MTKQHPPQVTITHHDVHAPVYSSAELAGLKVEAMRTAKHIEILEEEVKNKKSRLKGLEALLSHESARLLK